MAEQLALDPFGVVVRHASACLGMVVVHTSRAEIYSRLWCVYEIAEALRSGTQVRIACSVPYVNSGAGKLEEMLTARTQEAKCKNMLDEMSLKEKIAEKMTFKELDKIIFQFRFDALRELMQKHAGRLKSTIASELERLAAERPERRRSREKVQSLGLQKWALKPLEMASKR